MPREMRLLALSLMAALFVSCAPATQQVTLKSGKTFEVATERGLPLRYHRKEISILDLGTTALIPPGPMDKIPWIWKLTAELKEKGDFTVTVTTPMDEKLSTIFEAKGPGRISERFFSQADYPTIWEGFEEPGSHWFPFHFIFEEKASKRWFEFTQWAQSDSRTLEEIRTIIQKQREGLIKRP